MATSASKVRLSGAAVVIVSQVPRIRSISRHEMARTAPLFKAPRGIGHSLTLRETQIVTILPRKETD
ncbi:hypothetical protein GCM10007301_42440 [Azorhizobium oxalatiphilum]|uniref:Uncharacterized protein n=1 Tax=Azorhizobium oxalatiphilum TaxID=980631 RepID=A0A917C8I8_9HYPH|nr:hypothetical protein GCM10007301_42440 [Azorhizobium oxalatiphilum]